MTDTEQKRRVKNKVIKNFKEKLGKDWQWWLQQFWRDKVFVGATSVQSAQTIAIIKLNLSNLNNTFEIIFILVGKWGGIWGVPLLALPLMTEN